MDAVEEQQLVEDDSEVHLDEGNTPIITQSTPEDVPKPQSPMPRVIIILLYSMCKYFTY